MIRNNGILCLLIASVYIAIFTVDVQATVFDNLGFESGVVSASLPYWTDNSIYGRVGLDDVALSSVAITLHDTNSPAIKPIQGNYTALLQAGFDSQGILTDAYISQIGDIPPAARSLMFETDMTSYVSRLEVTLNGVEVPFEPWSSGGTVNASLGPIETYIGDISSFAGHNNVELKFTLKAQYPLNYIDLGAIDLDGIKFSTISAPEPSSLALCAIASLSMIVIFFRRRYR